MHADDLIPACPIINEVRIYNRALSKEEIQALYITREEEIKV